MKKIISLVILAGFVFTVNAQLLESDSTLISYDEGATYYLTGTDSTYHDANNCRQAYVYSKMFTPIIGQLSGGSYRTYDYFPNGNLRQVVYQTLNLGVNTYSNISRSTYTYYQSTSKILTSLSETWVNNSTWQNASLETNTYDANGYLILSVYQGWDIPSGTWVKNNDITYYNKSNGLPDSSITKEYDNNVVVDQTKDINTYIGSTTSLFRTVTQNRVNNQWQDTLRTTLTYNGSGKPTITDIEAYDPQTQTWSPVGRTTFTYYVSGELRTITLTISTLGFSITTQTRFKYATCTTSSVTPGETCGPSGNTTLNAGLTGTSYQWQVNTGGGFVNITNNANYSGVTTATLNLTNVPSSWAGYQYRCVVNAQNSSIFTLKFVNKWIGTSSSVWENGANWSCGTVPDANTDVIIGTGIVVLNSNTSVRSLTVSPGARFTANTGFKLTITH